jgi:hypothetical protein
MANARASNRDRFIRAATLASLLSVTSLVTPSGARAQGIFYHFGLTSSYTVTDGCVRPFTSFLKTEVGLPTTDPSPCLYYEPGRRSFGGGLYFFTGGASWVIQPNRFLELQTGAFLTLKGSMEDGRDPNRRGYLEVPVLLGLGWWPSKARKLGAGMIAGIAGDLGIPKPGASDAARLVGTEVRGRSSSGSEWSLSLRYARGMRKFSSRFNQSYVLLFGFSPARRAK